MFGLFHVVLLYFIQQSVFALAGYSYDPKTETPEQGKLRCAQALADAEAQAERLGYTFEWERDDITNRSFTDEGPEYYLWSCVCRNRQGKVIASLGGVDFGPDKEPSDDPYKRVVEAELASEAVGDCAGPCEACGDKGYLICQRSDNRLAVEKCDTCDAFASDIDAAKHSSIACSLTYPCVIETSIDADGDIQDANGHKLFERIA